jgi:pimeloyl-ACP methyl ester carboxylesterase
MAIYTSNGLEIHYRVLGAGYPILLLHGFTGTGELLEELFNDLSKEYQLIIPDLRGHGRSNNPGDRFRFKEVSQDIEGLLEHLKIKECGAVGFSAGASTLLHIAYRNPTLLKWMVLVSAMPRFTDQARVVMKAYSAAEKTQDEWAAMRKIHAHGDKQIKALWRQAGEFGDDNDDMNFTPKMLSTISAKTLIVQGDNDPFLPIDVTIEMYKAMPNKALWILPHSGHVPISEKNIMEFKVKVREMDI